MALFVCLWLWFDFVVCWDCDFGCLRASSNVAVLFFVWELRFFVCEWWKGRESPKHGIAIRLESGDFSWCLP
jgi:hypothetical protein